MANNRDYAQNLSMSEMAGYNSETGASAHGGSDVKAGDVTSVKTEMFTQ